MKKLSLTFCSIVALTTAAWAQPELQPPPDPNQQLPPPPPQPQYQPPTLQPPPPPPQQVVVVDTGPPVTPTVLAIGIGIGYVFPTSLEMPNTASVRIRIPSGVTFEPTVTLQTGKVTTDDGTNDTENARSEIALGTTARLALSRHGKIELELLGSLNLSSVKDDPDGDNNDTTTTTFGIGWGVGVTYWIRPWWSLSLSAANPLISYSKSKRELPPPVSMDMKQSTTSFGAVFDPTVSAMVHLFH